eukprot:gene1788-56669_t
MPKCDGTQCCPVYDDDTCPDVGGATASCCETKGHKRSYQWCEGTEFKMQTDKFTDTECATADTRTPEQGGDTT